MTRLAAISALAILLAATAAHADGASSAPVDPAADRAEALGEEAYQANAAGRHRDAIELYLRAFDAAPAARFLLNIADLYEVRLRDHERAVIFYRRYVESPDAEPDLARRALDRLSAPTPMVPSPPGEERPAPPPPPKGSPSSMRTWGYVAGATGVGALVAGIVLALVAKSKNDDAARSCVGQACTDPRALTLSDQAAGLATAADVAFVAGGVLVAGGLTLVLLSPSPNAPPRGLAVSGVFR